MTDRVERRCISANGGTWRQFAALRHSIAIESKADILRVCRGHTLSSFRQAIARLSRQRFRFWEWPVFSASAFLRLGLDHLVQPAGNKNGHVLLRPGIFSIAFLRIKPKTDNVPSPLSDQLEFRLGCRGVADLRRISKIDVQHGEKVRRVGFPPTNCGLTTGIFFQATNGAGAEGERKSKEQGPKPDTKPDALAVPGRRFHSLGPQLGNATRYLLTRDAHNALSHPPSSVTHSSPNSL